ncbi:MAG: hypothetical protein J5J06_14570 [Phycisphaerae bacterium]|nr:hypothetical protein [Phycisphaerae bacterium]
MTSQQEKQFTEALMKLETALEKPVIPGEMESWARDVRNEAASFDHLLRERVAGAHAELYASITDEDQGLFRRVEQLRQEDFDIRNAYDAFLSEASTLCENASRAEPQEAPAESRIAQISDNGLALVIRIRKQELALRTWLVESAFRDRGVQD